MKGIACLEPTLAPLATAFLRSPTAAPPLRCHNVWMGHSMKHNIILCCCHVWMWPFYAPLPPLLSQQCHLQMWPSCAPTPPLIGGLCGWKCCVKHPIFCLCTIILFPLSCRSPLSTCLCFCAVDENDMPIIDWDLTIPPCISTMSVIATCTPPPLAISASPTTPATVRCALKCPSATSHNCIVLPLNSHCLSLIASRFSIIVRPLTSGARWLWMN